MNQNDQLYQLGVSAWEFRRQNGFSKALPEEIRSGVAELLSAGVSGTAIAKTLGVTKTTIGEWKKKYSKPVIADFREVTVVDERPSFEVKLSATVQGCQVELTGSDFSLLQRLLRKLG